MVAFPTPALAATRSMHSPSGPDSANRLSAASMMAWSACSLRGRPGRRATSASAVLLLTVQPSALTGPDTCGPAATTPSMGGTVPADVTGVTVLAVLTVLADAAGTAGIPAAAATGS